MPEHEIKKLENAVYDAAYDIEMITGVMKKRKLEKHMR